MISFVGMVLIIITILLFFLYAALMIYYWLGWRSFSDFKIDNSNPSTTISIIIPARNEEKNIAQLLQALIQQDYPNDLFEIIVVDDHSTDRTAEIVREFHEVKLIRSKGEAINSHKKKAIEEGIAAAQNSFIVTTDADCIPPVHWLRTISSFKEKNNSAFIAAPVAYKIESKNFLSIFQTLDFLVLQGVGAVSAHKNFFPMCNGANIGYNKKIFLDVDGFTSIDKIASGDDMLLMQKISKRFPQQVHYLKSKQAIVTTEPVMSWKKFFNQRLRWASKARFYKSTNIFFVELLVYFFNLSFLALLIASFWDLKFLICVLLLWVAKNIIEFPFVSAAASWFNQRILLKWFFFFQPFHITYTIIVGLLAQFVKYEWKGRKVN